MVWKRGPAVLTAGVLKISPDPRLRLVDGHNLEIREVNTQDAGDYTCQIATLKPREITHTLEVLGTYVFFKNCYSFQNFQNLIYTRL